MMSLAPQHLPSQFTQGALPAPQFRAGGGFVGIGGANNGKKQSVSMINSKKGGAQGQAHMAKQGKAGKRGGKRRIPYYLKKSKNEKRVRIVMLLKFNN